MGMEPLREHATYCILDLIEASGSNVPRETLDECCGNIEADVETWPQT